MKKLLLLLLLPVMGFAQDVKYAESLNDLTVEQLREVSDDIISSFVVPQKFFATTKNSANTIFFLYYPADLPDRIINEDYENGRCSLCNTVQFSKFLKGRNVDLGIEGKETYRFKYVSGKYLDLFSWWQKHFAPTSTKENLLEKDSELRYIEDRNRNINIRFVSNYDSWEIRNAY